MKEEIQRPICVWNRRDVELWEEEDPVKVGVKDEREFRGLMDDDGG